MAAAVINGVAASRVFCPPADWVTVLDFLAMRFPHIAPEIWRQRLVTGKVSDEQGQVLDEHSRYRPGATLCYYREVPPEAVLAGPVTIVHGDAHLLVADKPHFLPVMPGGRFVRETLLVRLREQLGEPDLVPVHRLDRDTAGLVLLSRRPDTRDAYTALFRSRAIRKTYEVLAPLREDLAEPLHYRSRLEDAEEFFRSREVAGEPNSASIIQLIGECRGLGRYRVQLLTGRKHQIRVHFAALGIAIENDRLYPVWQPDLPDDAGRPLQLLARELAFTDPVSGEDRHFISGRVLS